MNWEEKYRAVSELVDGYRRERDEARRAMAHAQEAAVHVENERDMVRGERDEALHVCGLRLDMMKRLERDRDKERDAAKRAIADAEKDRDEARAEVERLRLDIATSNESFAAGYTDGARDAFRRGAEAMREACAMLALTSNAVHGRVDVDALRALPIPDGR